MAKRKKNAGARRDIVYPTEERGEHSPVERVQRQIADIDDNPSQPFRVIDILEVMERRMTITPEMRKAGEMFRDDFTRAALEPLHATAFAMDRVDGVAGEKSIGSLAARRRVWNALVLLGGLRAPMANLAWHVLGEQKTLKQWAIRDGWNERPVHSRTASGLMIGTLSILAVHYGLDREVHASVSA